MTDPIVNADVKGEEEKLAAEKALAQGTEKPAEKGEKMIPKTRFDEVNTQKKEALEALERIATEFVNSVPEDFKHLIPNLSPVEKINWIQDATKSGIFGKPLEQGIDTRRPGGKVPLDLNGMDAHSLRKMGYKTK